MSIKRKRIWIHRLQTYLSIRIALYFIFYQIAVWIFVYLQHSAYERLKSMFGEGVAWYTILLIGVGVILIGLLFILDSVYFIHRVVGPLFRVRSVLRAISKGEEVPLVSFRKNDLLPEFHEEMNEMLKNLEKRGAIKIKSSPSSGSPPSS